MLALTREIGQKILIGDDVVVTVLSVSPNGRVRLGIDAPRHIRIDRQEVIDRIRQENVESASAAPAMTVDTAEWASYGERQSKAKSVEDGANNS